MRSLALYNWISSNQPCANCEFAHGWWEILLVIECLVPGGDFFQFDKVQFVGFLHESGNRMEITAATHHY
jgi:hypothetical protein